MTIYATLTWTKMKKSVTSSIATWEHQRTLYLESAKDLADLVSFVLLRLKSMTENYICKIRNKVANSGVVHNATLINYQLFDTLQVVNDILEIFLYPTSLMNYSIMSAKQGILDRMLLHVFESALIYSSWALQTDWMSQELSLLQDSHLIPCSAYKRSHKYAQKVPLLNI